MANFEKAPVEVQEILSKPIQQLGLKLEGSPLERFVQQLYQELEAKGLKKFRPKCYLTDEWGCPNMEPVIGIPFYLADPKLQRLESAMNDIEDARQIMMYMRHEAGHAFNYAYALYKTEEWRELSDPSAGLIATTTNRFRSRASSCGTWRAGTRRSIPTKISPKPSRCG